MARRKRENGEKAAAGLKLSDLAAWDRNPRRISDAAADGLRESMGRFGDLSTIVWNRRLEALVCGHQRVEQARKLADGADPEIKMLDDETGVVFVGPHAFKVRVVDFDSETHAAANIVANSSVVAGQWTEDLGSLLADVASQDRELFDALRFDELAKIEKLLDQVNGEPAKAPEAQIDKAEELQKKWKTQLGQLWSIGKHRLLCGDATSAEDVERLMDGEVAFIMVTDPPYGVNYNPQWRNEAAAAGQQ